MAGAGVSIRIEPGAGAAYLEAAARESDDLLPLTRTIGALLVQSARDRISISNTGPDGTPWLPSTRAKEEGGKTLEETARLRDSLDYDATSTGVAVGTNVVYAAIHQFGGVIKVAGRTQSIFHQLNKAGTGFNRKGRFVRRSQSNFQRDVTVGPYEITMPARPYLGISGQDGADIEGLALDFIEGLGA